MKLIVICSWCNRFIKFKNSTGKTPPKCPISHGICEECAEKLKAEAAPMKCVNNQ